MRSELLAPSSIARDRFVSSSIITQQNILTLYFILISCMPHLLNTPALVNQVMSLSTDEKYENIFALHIAS